MKIPFPKTAKPHEVAILFVYFTVSRDPITISEFLHYRNAASVYSVIRHHRPFINQMIQEWFSSSTTLQITQ